MGIMTVAQAAKDFSSLVNDPDDLTLEEVIDAHLSRAAVWDILQRSLKAKADFQEVGLMAELNFTCRMEAVPRIDFLFCCSGRR